MQEVFVSCEPHIKKSPHITRAFLAIQCYFFYINTKKSEIIDINLIKIFNAGPEVSLKGSPTVSPITAALCASEPLPPKLPASIYFLALSQTPPVFAIIK